MVLDFAVVPIVLKVGKLRHGSPVSVKHRNPCEVPPHVTLALVQWPARWPPPAIGLVSHHECKDDQDHP